LGIRHIRATISKIAFNENLVRAERAGKSKYLGTQVTRIEIKRGKGYKDLIRAYKVELDDKEIGDIDAGKYVSFDIEPGKHRLRLKIDWCSSNYVDFGIVNGQTLTFECGNNVPPLLELIYIAFLRGKYLWVKQMN
jgi:hypothetical protein